MAKGLLALDLDGTLTVGAQPISAMTHSFLLEAHQSGWEIAIITGRSFEFAMHSLRECAFPFTLAVQNGALTLQMPGKRVLSRCYISGGSIPDISRICRYHGLDFVVCSGWEGGDQNFYLEGEITGELLTYLLDRGRFFQEKWVGISSFSSLEEEFASFKCFGDESSLSKLSRELEGALELLVPVIRDPYNWERCVLQATHFQVNKGSALLGIRQSFEKGVPVIAVGDDWNDHSMFEQADYKIVMQSAPALLKEYADDIAGSVEENGAVAALEKAIASYELSF